MHTLRQRAATETPFNLFVEERGETGGHRRAGHFSAQGAGRRQVHVEAAVAGEGHLEQGGGETPVAAVVARQQQALVQEALG